MRSPLCSALRRSVLFASLTLLCGASVGSASANDVAANYADTTQWADNNHRGTATAANWTFESNSGSNGRVAGRYIGNSALGGADINTDGKCFALFAWPTGTDAFAAAVKRYYKPALTIGDTITFKMAVNLRNGNKGFSLRNSSGNGQFNFNVGRNDGVNDGYYIRNAASGPHDSGQNLGAYHADTVFTFTFTQRETSIDWTIQRSGGITASHRHAAEHPRTRSRMCASTCSTPRPPTRRTISFQRPPIPRPPTTPARPQ